MVKVLIDMEEAEASSDDIDLTRTASKNTVFILQSEKSSLSGLREERHGTSLTKRLKTA